ncbi:MAG: cytochrome c biogenesis protein [Gemmatimonadetes bacterium]|nr:cytochrome c biogenesis protein [Gemmatimonadota bacterium]
MTGWLHPAALVLYAIAAVLMAVSFARNDRRLPVVASGSLGLGLLLHGWALFAFTSVWNELPLVGLGPFLSTLAFLIAVGTLIASTLGHALTVGLVLIPVIVVLVGVAAGVGVAPAGDPQAFQGIWFVVHVLFALVGYVGLTVAFAAGLMYLLQFRELKSKHFGAIFRFFPPLETLDRLGRLGLIVGFPFLTLALLAGWAWTARFQGVTAPEMSKLAWAIVSWFVFVGAFAARLGGGRRGHRGAVASVLGFLVVVIVYLVVRVQSSNGGAFL